eukprot:gnl/TRDRNA2_/TRDRNA2_86924_c0_seq1.p1 gnl/TRDRNA2_/TRDRNA2_86924_c0~~gnl/TRDRNA2_/TRDRNA2_86924_c0_seq1.p1  ORF type:complete len:617 (+),score=124.38 gnl/TRDRNA2_/TRDRNA2_86924_c0_seq1:79-1929(+)
MVRKDGKKTQVDLKNTRYAVQITWDTFRKSVDLDLQAVIVDERGLIADAVYYNNQVAMNGAVGHSGDAADNDKVRGNANSETIWVNLAKLPKQVKLIVFVVASHNEGHLRDVQNGLISLCEETPGNVVKKMRMEESKADVDIVAMMKRGSSGDWKLVQIDEPAEKGAHFLDILEPNIGDLIRKVIPRAPSHIRVDFDMVKDSVVDLPAASALKRLSVGVGGLLCPGLRDTVELAVSAVFYDVKGKCAGAVCEENSSMFGVAHLDDSKSGNELISVDLRQVPADIVQIFFAVNVTTKDATFSAIDHTYCRITDQACSELARYDIQGKHDESGLIISRLFKENDRWLFQALGTFCNGRSWEESQSEMAVLFHASKSEVKQKPGKKDRMPLKRRLSQQNLQPVVEQTSEQSSLSTAPTTEGRSVANAAEATEAPAKATAKPLVSIAEEPENESNTVEPQKAADGDAADKAGPDEQATGLAGSVGGHVSSLKSSELMSAKIRTPPVSGSGPLPPMNPLNVDRETRMERLRSGVRLTRVKTQEEALGAANELAAEVSCDQDAAPTVGGTKINWQVIDDTDGVPVKDSEDMEEPTTRKVCSDSCTWVRSIPLWGRCAGAQSQ